MPSTFVFSGHGAAIPRNRVTNRHLENLAGLDRERVVAKPAYAQYASHAPDPSPVDYFVREVMGFGERYHVAPYPPAANQVLDEDAVDLAERAFREALADARIGADDVDAWVLSTTSGTQISPDAASMAKSRLVGRTNRTPTIPLQMGCPGFHLGLEKGLEFLQSHPKASHVMVGHTETMSRFLVGESQLMPYATFGDGAASVVLSRADNQRGGLLRVVNHQDPGFIPILGVSREQRLFIDAAQVKERAIADMALACGEVLHLVGWEPQTVELFVPHQTGKAILLPLADAIGLGAGRLHLETQRRYGNTAGATVPMALHLLAREGQLRSGARILSATAGVGGAYGAFAYQVP